MIVTEPSVVLNADASRYEVKLGGVLVGVAEYEIVGDQVIFEHTELDDAHAHEGLAKALAEGALDDVVRRGWRIVPICPFITKFVLRNQDTYDDHVTWPKDLKSE